MLVPLAGLIDVFDQIRKSALQEGCSVFIFVAPDCDALCACKILSELLKADCIRHIITPVSCFSDLGQANEDLLSKNPNYRTLVLLNCGGLINLIEFFKPPEGVVFYVVDSHRPFDIANIESRQVYLVDDGTGQAALDRLRERQEARQGEADSSTDEGDDEADDAGTSSADNESDAAEAEEAGEDDEDEDDDDGAEEGDAEDEEDDEDEQADTGASGHGSTGSSGLGLSTEDAALLFDADDESGSEAGEGAPVHPPSPGRGDVTGGTRVEDLSADVDESATQCSSVSSSVADLLPFPTQTATQATMTTTQSSTQDTAESSSTQTSTPPSLLHRKRPRASVIQRTLRRERRRRHRKERRRRQAIRDAESLVREYYRGTYFSTSVANILYSLAADMNRDNTNLLWWAVLGLTDQLVHERTSYENYLRIVEELSNEVRRWTADDTQAQQRPRRHNEGPLAVTTDEHPMRLVEGVLVPAPLPDSIQARPDYRFVCYRHWTLYDSMYFCNYVAARLAVWRDSGEKALQTLFAKIGVPTRDCRQLYTTMSRRHKQTFHERIAEIAPQFGLQDLTFPSFQRLRGFEERVSASDSIYGLTALLECTPQADDPAEEKTSLHDLHKGCAETRDMWKSRFWRAYDALSNSPLLAKGIRLSIELQKALITVGKNLYQNKEITVAGPFRFAVLHDSPELRLLQYPLALGRLASFVSSVFEHRGSPAKPFVLCVHRRADAAGDSAVVIVGTTPMVQDSDHPNPFGAAFKRATKDTDARVRHDGFESSVIEIHGDDFTKFMASLHSYATFR